MVNVTEINERAQNPSNPETQHVTARWLKRCAQSKLKSSKHRHNATVTTVFDYRHTEALHSGRKKERVKSTRHVKCLDEKLEQDAHR